jgi:chromosome segregation ATPase
MSEIAVAMDTVNTDLDERISAAFGNKAKSAEVKPLIGEVGAAAMSAGKAAEKARGRALDPALTPKRVAEARREMEDAGFRRERLENAVTRLRERLNELLDDEEDQRRLIAYKKALAERDKLAAELKAVYPVIEAQLRDVLARLDANDKQIEHINERALPRDEGRLLVAELVARGLLGFTASNGISNIPRITQALRLPAFQYDQFEPYAWPGQR